jgi:hypothetical protein
MVREDLFHFTDKELRVLDREFPQHVLYWRNTRWDNNTRF